MKKENSKDAIRDALYNLLSKKQIYEITVGEICEDANVSRRTFYNFFQDKYNAAEWILENFNNGFFTDNSIPTIDGLLIYFDDYCEKNKEFFKNTLCDKGERSISNYFAELIQEDIEYFIKDKYTEGSKQMLRIAFKIFSQEIVRLAYVYVSSNKKKYITKAEKIDQMKLFMPRILYNALYEN